MASNIILNVGAEWRTAPPLIGRQLKSGGKAEEKSAEQRERRERKSERKSVGNTRSGPDK